MTDAIHMGSQYMVSGPTEVSSFEQKKAEAMAKLKARKTTFTADNIEIFNDQSTPEVSGELRKRFVVI